MPTPVPNFITLPSESGNTGKLMATQQRTEGANTVQLHRFIAERAGLITGVYGAATALQSVAAAAQNGTSTGFLWAFMGAAAPVAARLRQVVLKHNILGTTTMATLPRIALSRFTWAGTLTGGTLLPARFRTGYAAPVLDLRTAMTGATITLAANPGNIIAADLVPIAQVSGTAASFATQPTTDQHLLRPDAAEDEWVDIRPGEGVVLWQPDAGTASDTRRFVASLVWDEIDIA